MMKMNNNVEVGLMSLIIFDLKCEHLKNPLGIDCKEPSFSWKFKSDERNTIQSAYHIKVAETMESLSDQSNLVWDSGKISSNQSIYIVYLGEPLRSKIQYYWKVMVWDNHGNAVSSDVQTLETAFLKKKDWKAKWIEPVQESAVEEPILTIDEFMRYPAVAPEDIQMQPCQYVRKVFVLNETKIKKARIYITAHGIYRVYINGNRVSDDEFAPGNTTYTQYLQYQTYDITAHLNKGENIIGVIVADGWYLGRVGFGGDSCQYGNMLGLLFQIEVEHTSGDHKVIISDKNSKASTGPLVFSDIFVGEKYDATKEIIGWNDIGFDDTSWLSVNETEYEFDNLRAQYGETVKRSEELSPKAIYQSEKDETIIDFGQVIAGRVELIFDGAKRGDRVVMEHSEIVDKYGSFLNNIQGRYKNQMDIYICKGGAKEVYEPYFTFHGFRYIRISGYPNELKKEHVKAMLLRSNTSITGEFSCSDERLNRLQQNILWSQKGNMLSIPTDCPQRERAGWTGDVQVFSPTAVFNMDSLAFFKRWLKNVREDQLLDGQVPTVVPYMKGYRLETGCFPMQDTHCSAGWGDVCVILPWVLYNTYGDSSVLSENYQMMKRWVEYIRKTAETENPEDIRQITPERSERLRYLWNTHFHFGDWLTPSVSFDFETGDVDMIKSAFATKEFVPTCFFAYSSSLLSEIAKILGFKSDAKEYAKLSKNVKKAFAEEFIDDEGKIETQLQGIYILALKFGLIPKSLKGKALNHLVELIEKNGNKLDTGFLSGPFILDVLVDGGREDVVWELLFQEECPSWLYEVKMGATTIWEAWQAVLPDGTPTTVSFNHYAFGCVGDWMYRHIAGINAKEEGYKHIEIKPLYTEEIASAYGQLRTVYGDISCAWKRVGEKFMMDVSISANTKADIYLPTTDTDSIKESGRELKALDLESIIKINDSTCITVGSGNYRFMIE